MNNEISLYNKDREELLKEKLITVDNYYSDKKNFMQNIINVYMDAIEFLDVYTGINIEDLLEEIVTHNYSVCYEIALLYCEDEGITSIKIDNLAGNIYDEVFNARGGEIFLIHLLQALSELNYSYSINIDAHEALMFKNCQNTLLREYTRKTEDYLDSLGYMMFDPSECMIVARGGIMWENYQQNLIGSK